MMETRGELSKSTLTFVDHDGRDIVEWADGKLATASVKSISVTEAGITLFSWKIHAVSGNCSGKEHGCSKWHAHEDRSIDLSSKPLLINEEQGQVIFNSTFNTHFR